MSKIDRNVPPGVSLTRTTPCSGAIARGDKTHKPSAYLVHRKGKLLGRVERGSEASHRQYGRIRGSLIGYPMYWEAEDPAGNRVGYRFAARRAAIEELMHRTEAPAPSEPDGTMGRSPKILGRAGTE